MGRYKDAVIEHSERCSSCQEVEVSNLNDVVKWAKIMECYRESVGHISEATIKKYIEDQKNK